MGGYVNVTVRTASEEFRMTWGTSALRYFFNSPEFLCPEPHIDAERILRWRQTPELAGMLAPSEYGLVVVDFRTRTLLDFNDYLNLGAGYVSDLRYSPVADDWLQLYACGQIESIGYRLADPRKHPGLPRTICRPTATLGASAESILQVLQGGPARHVDPFYVPETFNIALRPFQVIRPANPARVTLDEWKACRNTLTHTLGFKLTEQEVQCWDSGLANPA